MWKIYINPVEAIAKINALLILAIFALAVADSSVLQGQTGINAGPLLFLVILVTALFNLRLKVIYTLFVIPVAGWITISTTFNSSNMEMGQYNSAIMSGTILLLFVVHLKYIDRTLFVRGLSFLLIFCVILTFYLRINNISFLENEALEQLYASDFYGAFGRMQAFFLNPNRAAIFFVASAQLALVLIRHPLVRFSLFGAFALLTLFTFSKTSIGVLVIFTTIYCMLRTRARLDRVVKVAFSLFMGGIIVGLLFSVLFPDEARWLFLRITTAGLASREEVWGASLKTATESPRNFLLGIGPNMFQYYVERKGQQRSLSSHNSYLNALVNFGFPFVLFSLSLLFFTLYDHLRKRRYLLIPFFVSVLMYGMTESVTLAGSSLIWLSLPLMIQFLASVDPSQARQGKSSKTIGISLVYPRRFNKSRRKLPTGANF